jgi:hypothetical protein
VVDGSLEPYRGAVAGQLIGSRIRLFEYERKVKEPQEFEESLEVIEEHQKRWSNIRSGVIFSFPLTISMLRSLT